MKLFTNLEPFGVGSCLELIEPPLVRVIRNPACERTDIQNKAVAIVGREFCFAPNSGHFQGCSVTSVNSHPETLAMDYIDVGGEKDDPYS